jgi:hypothetical protein
MSEPSEARAPAAPLSPRGAGFIGGLIAFAVYVATNHPQSLAHDAAEFQTLAATGGIAHAGYPLLVILLELAGRIPISTIAYRANLLSCLAGATAVGLAVYGATRLTRRPLAGLAAGLALGLSMTLWNESTHAGIHAFSLALDAGIYLLARRFADSPGQRIAMGLGLLLGFSLVSHLTVLALVPVLVAAVAIAARAGRLRIAHLGPALAGILIGLSPLAYLVARDRPDQPMNYIESTLDLGSGQYLPADTPPLTPLQRAAWLLSARQYLAHTTFRPFEESGYRMRILALDVGLNELPLLGLPLALIGLGALRRRPGRDALFLSIWIAGCAFLVLFGAARAMISIFFLPGAWALAQLVAAGIDSLAARSRAREIALAAGLVALPCARVAVVSPPPPLAGHATLEHVWRMWPERWSPFRADDSWEAFGRGVMAELPPRAIVLSCWEEGMALSYFRYAEPLRTDVDIRLTCWDPRRVSRALAGAEGREVFATFDPSRTGMKSFRVEPRGHWIRGRLWRLVPANEGR